MYKCKNKECGKKFPVVAWIEGPRMLPQQIFGLPSGIPKSTIKLPCCPFCRGIEIEEVKD